MAFNINGTTGLTFNNGSTQDVGGVGIGQTWQNVTASRSTGTTYTNSTGKPICFMMTLVSSAVSNDYVELTIGGTTIFFIAAVVVSGVVFGQNMAIIPPGATYSYTSARGNTGKSVYELR
jgi:hypothetical protein